LPPLSDRDRFTEERNVPQTGNLAVVEILPHQEIEQQRESPQGADRPGEPRSPGPQVEPDTKPTSATMITQTGTWSQRSAVPNSPGVSARIIQTSHPAKTAVDAAVREKSRLAHAVRCLHQTSKCIAASVRHAEATMDQMMVTQLME